MRANILKLIKHAAATTLFAFLLANGASFADQVNLTAGPATATLPDGTAVPMWGYSCDATQVAGSTVTCAKLNPNASAWAPVVITVPTGTDLTVKLTNNLSFPTGTGTNNIPTSLVIVGQLGGGLGDVHLKIHERVQLMDHCLRHKNRPLCFGCQVFEACLLEIHSKTKRRVSETIINKFRAAFHDAVFAFCSKLLSDHGEIALDIFFPEHRL